MKEQDYPLVSVIMPAYNTEKYISEAINSILKQTYKNFELFIIDDCSTDRTVEIIKTYDDPRILFIQNDINRGYVYGLNKCINLAKGKYIARMDSDDVSMFDRLQKQVTFMEANPDISILGMAFQLSNNNTVIQNPRTDDQIRIRLLEANALGHPTVMIRKKDLISFNLLYDHNYLTAEDYELWTRISQHGLKMANLPDIGLIYRIHNTQISSYRKERQQKLAQKISTNYRYSYFRNTLSAEEINNIGDFFLSMNETINLIYKLWLNNNSYNHFDKYSFNKYLSSYLRQRLNKLNMIETLLRKKYSFLFKVWLINIYIAQIRHNLLHNV